MFNTGIIAKANEWMDQIRFNERIYKPTVFKTPPRLVASKSQAWVGLEQIIWDIIKKSGIKTERCLEFGVEFGYSTAVFANYFQEVTGVDIFTGDPHAGHHGDIYEKTKSNLASFPNIKLIRADYKDFILTNDYHVDLTHVDIIHTYQDTFDCGLWAAQHSDCTLFHDTQSFPEVKRAVADIARITKKKFFNYRKHNGLGILI